MNIHKFLAKHRIPMSKRICGNGNCTQVGLLLMKFEYDLVKESLPMIKRLVALYHKYDVPYNIPMHKRTGSETTRYEKILGKDLSDDDIIALFIENRLMMFDTRISMVEIKISTKGVFENVYSFEAHEDGQSYFLSRGTSVHKDSLCAVSSYHLNNIDLIEFHAYCFEEDIEKCKEAVRTEARERFQYLKDQFQQLEKVMIESNQT